MGGPAHPAEPEPVVRDPELSTRRRAVQKRDGVIPSVPNLVDATTEHTVAHQSLCERPRDRDHGIKLPKRAPLETLVQTVFPASACETVDGRDSRNPQVPRNSCVHNGGAIPMYVENVRPQCPAQPRNHRPLGEIGTWRDTNWHDFDARLGERTYERMVSLPELVDHGDAHSMPQSAMALGQGADHTLKPSNRARRQDVEDHHPTYSAL